MRTRRWDFVSTHRAEFGVKRLCRVLGVSRSSFYAHEAGAPARRARAAADAELTERIRVVHAASHDTYGVPRVTAELRAEGHGVNRKRTARLMREAGIVGRHLRRRVRTTVRDRAAVPAPDLVERDFTASARDVKWVGDITYLPVGDGWLYLATVIDLHSRRLIGWSIADHMRASLVVDAIEAAIRMRGGSVTGVVFHSDRGTQYTSSDFAKACERHGIRRSMGKVGSSYDNAAAESFFATCKREVLHGGGWLTEHQARIDVFRWIAFYNHRRRHSFLRYVSPAAFEAQATKADMVSLAA